MKGFFRRHWPFRTQQPVGEIDPWRARMAASRDEARRHTAELRRVERQRAGLTAGSLDRGLFSRRKDGT